MGRVASAYDEMVSRLGLANDAQQVSLAQLMDEMLTCISQQKTQNSLKAWLGLSKPTPIKGIYIYGPVGRGKSMMMDLLVSCAGKYATRLHYSQWMAELHGFMRQARSQNVDPIAFVADKVATGRRLICVDELEIRDITDAMLLARVVGTLFSRGLIFVFTSNTKLDDLYEGGLNRPLFLPFITAIKENCTEFCLDHGQDYRRIHLQQEGFWHVRERDGCTHVFTQLWRDWTMVHKETERLLPIQGRVLPIIQSGRAARVKAPTLFEEYRGSVDYEVLSNQVDVIFLEALMPFTQRDHARRFVLFIDRLYEDKRVLIVDASANPEKLYNDTQNLGFARTCSRLHEMGAQEWLGRVGMAS